MTTPIVIRTNIVTQMAKRSISRKQWIVTGSVDMIYSLIEADCGFVRRDEIREKHGNTPLAVGYFKRQCDARRAVERARAFDKTGQPIEIRAVLPRATPIA